MDAFWIDGIWNVWTVEARASNISHKVPQLGKFCFFFFEDLSNYEQAFIAACVVYVAFVLASPRGKNILQDELAAKLIIKMNAYSDSPIDFSDYVRSREKDFPTKRPKWQRGREVQSMKVEQKQARYTTHALTYLFWNGLNMLHGLI